MTAYSFQSYALRDKKPEGEQRTTLITIQHGHRLNNEHRAPFASGATAARMLLNHAERQLGDADRGRTYFEHLRAEYDRGTINGGRIDKRLKDRQHRAANALSLSDVELTSAQLENVAAMALVHARVAEKLLPALLAQGHGAEKVIDQVDVITRNALRSAALERSGIATERDFDPNAWQRDLLTQFAASDGIDHSDDLEVVAEFAGLIANLEAQLPMAVERDVPLYDIDHTLAPDQIAATVDRLSLARGGFPSDDLEADDLNELQDLALDAVYANMSTTEREFHATHVALTPAERVEVGIQLINSTPPLIKLPEAELAAGRFDVRMATEEEARVMEALIRYAGETRVYPGPEAARAHVEGMKEISMPSGAQGKLTMGLAVANNEPSIERATTFIRSMAATPEWRLAVHTDNDELRAHLMNVRATSLQEAGHAAPALVGSETATREFGGWSLGNADADYFIGEGRHDAAILVAVSDVIETYSNPINLEIGSINTAYVDLQRANNALTAVDNDIKRAREAVEAARDPALVAAVQALQEQGKDDRAALDKAWKSAPAALRQELKDRTAARTAASAAVSVAQRKVDTMERQRQADAFRRSSPGDIARATIVDLAVQQGKLAHAWEPSNATDGAVVATAKGGLSEPRTYIAQQQAQRLRNGDVNERGNLRRLFHASRGVNAILIDGSNYFREDKGAKKGMEALRARLADLPKTATILTSNNERNAISSEVATKLGRNVIAATAWRITEKSKVGIDGRDINLSERSTALDLGMVSQQGGKVRHRDWVYRDLKGAVIAFNGGGSMNRDTYEAIQSLAEKRGVAGHSLSANEVLAAHAYLVANGHPHLEAPKIANAQLSRAIMQEALIDYANQAIIATDMGKDFHSANLIRQAASADKLAAVIDKEGKPVSIEAAFEHSRPMAQSISDNTRNALSDKLTIPTGTSQGQLILSSLPKVSTERAKQLAETYATIGDVMRAAEGGEPSHALPASLHHDLGRPNTWANAIDRASNIAGQADANYMDVVAATNADYPKALQNAGRSDILYVAGDIDLQKPTLALVIGGDKRPTAAEQEAVLTLARDAAGKDWGVSIHLSGETSASLAKTIASMPEAERPQIALITDGVPNVAGNMKAQEAIQAVAGAGGGIITATAPIKEEKGEDREPTFVADRKAALELQGRLSSGVVVVKSSGNDIEMLTVRAAMQAERPVAAFGASDLVSPTVDDLRYRGAEYSANRRLLEGGNKVSVMLDSSHLAFQPNFIPDMTSQMADRYVLFEGSAAGKQDTGFNNDQQIDRSAVEAGHRMQATIAWREPAEYLADGNGTAAFIDKIEAGEARQIEAREPDLIAEALKNDRRFLDTSHREDARADVKQVFAEMNEMASEALDQDIQSHFLASKAGRGR